MNKFLIIPGYQGSDENHWQSRWEKKYASNAERLTLSDFTNTEKKYWTKAILEQIKDSESEYVVIAHSLGALSFAHTYAKYVINNVKAALLVAPPDVEKNAKAAFLHEFTTLPDFKFKIPVYLVASTDDPYCKIERAGELAEKWGAELINVGPKGHINSESGIGDWPEGEKLLQELLNL